MDATKVSKTVQGYINFEDVNLPSGSDMNKYGQSKAGNVEHKGSWRHFYV
jgi:hypothetical protein